MMEDVLSHIYNTAYTDRRGSTGRRYTMCWPRVDNDRALIYHNDQVTSKTPTSDHLQIKKRDKQVHYVINLTFRILTQHKHKNWNSHCL